MISESKAMTWSIQTQGHLFLHIPINIMLVIQGDSFGDGPELMIKNDVIICQWKQNLASKYLGRCGDNWVIEDAEMDLPPSGDTGRHDAPCSRMLRPV